MTPSSLRDAMARIVAVDPIDVWPDQTKGAEARVRFRGDPLMTFLLSDDQTQAQIIAAANIGNTQQ